MARLIGRGPDIRLPSLRGRYIVRKWRGKDVIAAWPKPRGQNLSPKQREAVEKFRQANKAAHYVNPTQQNTMREITRGTAYLPRDLIISAMYGRFPSVVYRPGRNYYSMAARNDVSAVLDAIGQDQGNLLQRGETWWGYVPLGTPGQILTVMPGGTAFGWAPPAPPPAPRGCSIRTTSDSGTSSTWPKYPSFDVADWDDDGFWSAGAPDRITIPAGYTRARFSFTCKYTNEASVRGFFFGLELNLSGSSLPSTSTSLRLYSTGFPNNTFNGASPVIPVSAGQVYRMRLNCFPTYNGGWLEDTILSVEAW